ncbi:aspartate aminotransferase family protein [Haemophilus parahaemolyticus]|uniref:Acetylornithine aminotransferase n=2 Tax=Haemophilus parahaemolyticus TaxID=735 RepID=A0A377I0Q0_HAEPH|nr:aspartate aminotransferase family protein [Haemophilus parahaemolyticus]EIJ72480.1 transaminase, acetylornithine/succinylornithine family [Haemophilus parahaemolyticus HK385]OOR97355.1 aspartate aminotransferase family protein [Haemophilus parahaemolyticus]QEN11528.1 aspartate aminotransferase family protein [Haemophilus parahaemolyticus]QRP12729.1 aspartate aminotransferase family protein [Haemophilus parahaemolyticus]STO64113.1 acetylornithine aminotransferase [Haemophilus parahaemolyticu
MTNTTSNEIKQLDSDYIAQTYGRFNLALSHGKGCQVWDFEGNEYLDFTSGIGVNSLGWADEDWLKAVVHQASSLAHTSNLFFTEPSSRLAKKLAEASGLKRVFFANSGAEANEGAIKTARKYSHDKYGKDRATVLTLVNSFHGRTISTLSATGQEVFHQHFFPFTKGFDHTPANELRALETRLGQKDVCAIILEVVQGEGGVCSLDHEYLQGVQALCHQYDVLLIIDEVQTGIGRTGTMFAYQQFGLTPDIITLAKGLGGGLPIGAFVLGEKVQDTLGKSDHGSTFGANPVSCAGANAVLAKIDDAFLAEIKRKGEKLQKALAALPKVKSVSGLGLMIGVEFEEGTKAADIVAKCIEKGVLFLTAKTKLRLLPPLIINDEQIEKGIALLKEVLEA